jgi:hypothetical protein
MDPCDATCAAAAAVPRCAVPRPPAAVHQTWTGAKQGRG